MAGILRNSFRVLAVGVLVGLVFCTPTWASRTGTDLYVGSKPDRWSARILVRNGYIKAFRLTYTVSRQGSGKRNLSSWGGGAGSEPVSIRIRPGGGFGFRVRTVWGTNLLRGRVIGNRIRGFVWSKSHDQINPDSWSGYGNKPAWVGFRAWKTKPSQTEPTPKDR